ncbi:c-type cytochrome [Benzoatithermus flavus]|uniref:Cytochrome c n=1 Tax=Benzoatithermus flavus TaxID=3108223 RepID=A0ABU8XUA1_9PROT
MLKQHLPLVLLLGVLAACDQRMVNQAKDKAYKEAAGLPKHMTLQPPPEGTVARDEAAYRQALATRPPMTMALLERGRERFGIYCSPCHGRLGDGSGMIVQRGFPRPPSYHDQRLRQAPDRHFVDVITNGFGAMYGYAARVPPADRWAIVAYIRALQLSRDAPVAALPEPLRATLEAQK